MNARWLAVPALILAGLAGCGPGAGNDPANVVEVTSANHAWGGYHWARTSNPFTLTLGNNLSGVWQPYLSRASSDWSQSIVLDTVIGAGQTRPKPCKPTAGRVEVCSARYGNTGWLGVASIWLTDAVHITQGTVKLNDTYFQTARYDTPAWRQFVACQEVGHTFGLDHQDTTFDNTNLGSCMDYTNDPSGTAGTNGSLANTAPNKHDYDELVTIYTHLDTFTTIGQLLARGLPAQAADAAGDTPAEWGRLVRRSANGRLAVYERDLGGGNRVITFVIWA
jgi:hypothetical protein